MILQEQLLLFHQVRMLSEKNPIMVVEKVDMRNGHYCKVMAAVLEAMERAHCKTSGQQQATC